MIERVFVSPLGNVFMREIAEHLVEGLASKGHRPALITDALPSGADPFANLVVAPHEFFHLFPATVGEKMAGAASAVSVNTEQPGTPFFDIALPYLCLLYTSDAADERSSVDLGGRRIIKKKKKIHMNLLSR